MAWRRSVLYVVVAILTMAGMSAFGVERAAAQTAGPLPFLMPSKATLAASPKKVFAHYFTPYPLTTNNLPTDQDYYTTQWLNPNGENGIHAAYGGFLRDRPLPVPVQSGDWELTNYKKEISRAAAAGLDGFTLDVLKLSGYNWDRVNKIIRAAEQSGSSFKIMLMPDMTGITDATPQQLAAAMAQLAASPAVYRLNDGRVVISTFKAEAQPVSYYTDFIATMKNVYSIVVAFVPTFLAFSTYADAFAPISYGFGNWGTRSPGENNNLGANITLAHSKGKIWMQPVAYQDERPRSGAYWEANNSDNLDLTWRTAIGGTESADWVQLVTWNDYSENTQFSPSVRTGWNALDLSSYYLVRFKTGAYPIVTKDALYVSYRIQRSAATPSYPETLLMTLRTPGSPARDKIEVVSMMTTAGTVRTTIGGVTISYTAPTGMSRALFAMQNGSVTAWVKRGDTATAWVTSKYDIVTTPYVQDLQYYGLSTAR